MNQDIEKLRELIAKNQAGTAIDTFLQLSKNDTDLYTQATVLSAKFNDVRKKENLYLISTGEASIIRNQVNYAALDLINEYEKKVSSGEAVSTQKSVFISYNHNDNAVANKLKEKLEGYNIMVAIDSEMMHAGEDIKEYIEKGVRNTTATVSIVSKKSLLSSWVAMETINTYNLEKADSNNRFIPCYIEDDFFSRSFTDEALDVIDEDLKKMEVLIKNRVDKGRNTRDLNNEYTRLKELSHNLDEIVRRLRESLCIDIRDANLDKNISKIVDRIKG
jgi:hypothetical protein